jgi:hypothetical protein
MTVKRIFIHRPVLKNSQDRNVQKEIDFDFVEQKYFTSLDESMKSFEKLGIKTDDENGTDNI